RGIDALSSSRCPRRLTFIRDPPNPALLRVRYIERSVGSFGNPNRPISRRARGCRRLIECGEAVSKYCRRSGFSVAIERHEHDVVAVLVLGAVQHDEGAVAIRGRKCVAGVEEQIDGSGTT